MALKSTQQHEWKKRILLPIWALRIAAMLFVVVGFGLLLAHVKKEYGYYPGLGPIVLFYLLIIVVLLIDILQIIMFFGGKLRPSSLLIMNSVQSAIWGAVLLVELAYIAKNRENAAGIGFTVILLLLFLAILAYAAIIFKRQRKQAQRGHYQQTHNPAMPSAIPTPYTGPAVHNHNSAYHAPVTELGGGFMQQQTSYKGHGAATDYYNSQPMKPAHLV